MAFQDQNPLLYCNFHSSFLSIADLDKDPDVGGLARNHISLNPYW